MKLRIHPEDAKLYNIANGDEVEIYNNRGSVKIKVYYDDEVQQRHISHTWCMVAITI